MRLKSINVNGRRLSAVNKVVQRLGNGGQPYPELTFAQMDEILKAMEANKPTRVNAMAQSGGYWADIQQSECGDTSKGLVLTFGCWEVGNLETFKKVYEQLKELNQDPENKPNPDVLVLDDGTCLSIRNGAVWTCDWEGATFYDEVSTVEVLQKVITEMEHAQQMPVITYTGKPATIQRGNDGNVYLTIGCIVKDLAEVKKATDFLAAVQTRQKEVSKTAETAAS